MIRVTSSFAVILMALSGCGGSSDFTDIQQFMDEVDSRPRGRIDPLPPFEQVPPFAYQAGDKRSPFEPPVLVKAVDPRREGVQVEPDHDRVKQYLEQYTIGQLTMVGTLSQGPELFALVEDTDGGVHRVRVGDFMGSDHGKILEINEGSVELIEIVPDGTGGWVERARTVALGS